MRTRMRAIGLCAVLSLPGTAFGEVVYGGSSTLAETVLQGGATRGFEAKTGIAVRIADLSGTGKGLKALAEGKLNVVGSGRTLAPDEKKAGLLGTIVGYDGLAIFVNRANPVKDLTQAQLKDLYTGKAKSWKELGGKDVKIAAYIEPVASKRATVQLVQELVLDGAPYGAGIHEVEQLRDQLAEVARNEGGICVASIGFLQSIDPGVKASIRAVSLDATEANDANIRSGAYLLSRPMLLVTKGLPEGDVKRFIDFMLGAEGQAVVEKFFVRVKK
ncbi:MAG TPA: phosphate ABC transporter substrate-binding protein [Anaeromyxobacteraceae bacterium]|nr:phosphate ABC transporter substrate-binding protein [Anaeromyxobacteraceae bacterium]